MTIRLYQKPDEKSLFDLIKSEGEDWADYYAPHQREKYSLALDSSVVYVYVEDAKVHGYVRCREDDGFGVYIMDLLVRQSHRGKRLGRQLMERVYQDFRGQPVYVMSDVDVYYEKIGYRKEGSIFEVTSAKE